MNIPYRKLYQRLKDNTIECKKTKAYENNIITHSFLGILVKFINRFERMTEYEVGIFIKSFDKWLDRKDVVNTPENNTEINIGDVCMIDWNINYAPEMSYEHPALIIENINDYISVLPMSSQCDSYPDAYHPTINPEGNKNHWKVDCQDGFQKDAIIFLDGLKVVSKTRVINKMFSLENIEDNEYIFRKIRWHLFYTYFPYESMYLEEKYNNKNNEIINIIKLKNKQQSRADKLNQENIKLKKEIEKLNNIIDKNAEIA